uniref:Cytochrome c oxidase subunit 2 n=1 Tax=Saussurella borneensis TaxID=510017 RepID=A0A8F2JFE9_9ORTH|nr:cytochrome c oxidase subunit 2 [Saussurella borneensis]
MATWNNLSLQDSNSPLMEQLAFFHDHAMSIIIFITTLVGYKMFYLAKTKNSFRFMLSDHTIETIWTSVPTIVLVFIALPSLHLLYITDDSSDSNLTIKVIGRQWYWSYEYSDFKQVEFDSYMSPENEKMSDFRLLDVDNRTVLPMNMNIRLLTSASDVLHSWTVPSIGVKIDATPGRLNQSTFLLSRPGVLFGQCSEICGANHSFMPIALESVDSKAFIKWVLGMIN